MEINSGTFASVESSIRVIGRYGSGVNKVVGNICKCGTTFSCCNNVANICTATLIEGNLARCGLGSVAIKVSEGFLADTRSDIVSGNFFAI